MIFHFFSQNKALYCYTLLTLWIFLLIAGMYRYVGTEDRLSSDIVHIPNIPIKAFSKDLKPFIKSKRVLRQCNLPSIIVEDEEGGLGSGYSLENVIILLRHGDRGPMNHVRNVSSIDCSSLDLRYQHYNAFWSNVSLRQSTNPYLPFLSTFHNYPLVPPLRGICELGQLTPLGVTQLLKVGAILKSVYASQLGLNNMTGFESGDILLFSTPYRRTFQSLLAFLHEFLSPEDLQRLTIKEVSSLAFCFHDCACSAASYYTKLFDAQKVKYLKSHPAVISLVNITSNVVYELNNKHLSSDPWALRDALLSYVCHGASLPCHKNFCVKSEDVTGVFAYIEWETRQYSKMRNMRRSHLLKAYGLIKHLVSQLLKAVSEGKPRLIVYSGHDYSLRYLAVALGIFTDVTSSPYYASRFIIELYRSKNTLMNVNNSASRNHFLRIIFNGKDLTNKISFCKHAGFRLSESIFLCPIESVVRFLHEDYFSPFNTTNFKDACARS